MIAWIIENGVHLIACFLEILMIILCIYGIFKAKFKFTIANALLIVLDLIILSLAHIDINESWMLFIDIIGFIITIVILKHLHTRERQTSFSFDKQRWVPLLGVCVLCLTIIIIDYQYRGKVEPIYCFAFLILCLIASVSSISAQAVKHEMEKREIEMEMKGIYSDAYKELICEVRRKQHDFRNQLGVIYSMHLTANSLEDLVKKQCEYGNVLLEGCGHDKILLGCNNPILAGYLYYKCVAYEKSGVQVDYQIHVDGGECCLSLHEVIEILGILLTNAYENYHEDAKEKSIGLVIQENADNLMLEVSNRAEELKITEIERIFSKGYSSKGENRGIGLPRVKQLTSKVKADLIVANRLIENKNWVSFKVIIPKLEGE